MLEFSTTLEHFSSNIYGYHFPVSAAITAKMSSDSHKRVKCKVNNTVEMHSALMPHEGASYILVNQKIRKKLGLKLGDKVEMVLEKDTSTYGIPMPESFMVMLDQDEIGSEFFHALTPGKQRSLIYIMSKVKSVDKQINKALAILEHLTDVKGDLDFKLLQEKIKAYNQRERLH